MNEVYEKLLSCERSVREKTGFVPKIGIVLGSGLGAFADEITQECIIRYEEIDGFPVSTAPLHEGRFVFGYVSDVPVVVMQGRVHYYEGYDITDVVLPTRLMGRLGIEKLLLTNASGGISQGMHAGDFMLIKDHISSFVPSPLIGANIDELGVRFPDMSKVYDEKMSYSIKKCAMELDILLREGVYVQTTGPQYETPAEINMYRTLGADAVGMSTAVEAIAARHMGVRVAAVSCVSNLAAGISPVPLSHQEVVDTANKVAPDFRRLLHASVKAIAED